MKPEIRDMLRAAARGGVVAEVLPTPPSIQPLKDGVIRLRNGWTFDLRLVGDDQAWTPLLRRFELSSVARQWVIAFASRHDDGVLNAWLWRFGSVKLPDIELWAHYKGCTIASPLCGLAIASVVDRSAFSEARNVWFPGETAMGGGREWCIVLSNGSLIDVRPVLERRKLGGHDWVLACKEAG